MSRPPWLLALFVTHRRDLVMRATRLTRDAGTAEDIVQDAWIRFDGSASSHVVEDPIAYLRRIVRNLALDERRRCTRREEVAPRDPGSDPAWIAAVTAGAERTLIAMQELVLVTAELARMPPRMRRAVELHRLAGAALREVADELGVSTTTAHKLVTDGVERCRRCLDRALH